MTIRKIINGEIDYSWPPENTQRPTMSYENWVEHRPYNSKNDKRDKAAPVPKEKSTAQGEAGE